MPRPVAIRVSYRDDAGHLLRLEAAVVKDERQTPEWRDKTAKVIRQLSMLLLEANTSMNAESDSLVEAKAAARRRR
jgi:hypothetical protein